MDARDIFAYTVQLRQRVLDALRAVPLELLERKMHTNHHSIARTLIHVMVVEESWVSEDLHGEPQLSWEEFRERYLPGEITLDAIMSGWRRVTERTIGYLRTHPDLSRRIVLEGPGDERREVTAEQIIYHLAGEEMIHMGEVLAMTRQLGIDLPSYFLMNIMDAEDRPWERLEQSR